MLKKPFILTLLLLIISYLIGKILDIVYIFSGVHFGAWFLPIHWVIATLCLGIIYTSIYKIELTKNQKTKVILYYFFTTLPLLIIIHKLLIYKMLLVILVMIIGIFCMYPALTFGCKIGLKRFEKKDNQEV